MATVATLAIELLAINLGETLKTRNLSLALAESCTGGMVAQAVTSVAGSSAWFDRGFVTYSNVAKVEMLRVLPQTLDQYGAVSEETAKEMALGALRYSHAQIAGSITGIAGPDGGSAAKPVGMVCFGYASANKPPFSNTLFLMGMREEVRQQASAELMAGLMRYLGVNI